MLTLLQSRFIINHMFNCFVVNYIPINELLGDTMVLLLLLIFVIRIIFSFSLDISYRFDGFLFVVDARHKRRLFMNRLQKIPAKCTDLMYTFMKQCCIYFLFMCINTHRNIFL